MSNYRDWGPDPDSEAFHDLDTERDDSEDVEVSQDAQARDMAQRLIIDSSKASGYPDSLWLDAIFKAELTHRITVALQSHADAARPKVSEDDEKAAREFAAKWFREYANDTELIAAIAQDRASVRLAERNRIQGAVEKLSMATVWRDRALKAIDGQPGGGRE